MKTGIIKEPLNVDFVIDSREFTNKDRQCVLEFIHKDKLKRLKKVGKLNKKLTDNSESAK